MKKKPAIASGWSELGDDPRKCLSLPKNWTSYVSQKRTDVMKAHQVNQMKKQRDSEKNFQGNEEEEEDNTE